MTAGGTLVVQARELQPMPRARAREIETARRLPAELAQAEARLSAVRAVCREAVGEVWTTLHAPSADAGPDIAQRARLRLAATHAARTAAGVVRALYDLGGCVVYQTSPLQRRFRDAHAGTQHMMISPATYELTDRKLMELPTDADQL